MGSLYKVCKVCQMLKTILNSYQFLQANWGQLLMNSPTHSGFFPILKKIVVKYIHHRIYHFNYFLVYSSVTLSTFALLCNYHQHSSSELFCLPKLKLHPSLNNDSRFLLPQLLATTILGHSPLIHVKYFPTIASWILMLVRPEGLIHLHGCATSK